MRDVIRIFLLSTLLCLGACGDDSGTTPPIDGATQGDSGSGADAPRPVDANMGGGDGAVHCGEPGDEGNSMGVGEYCDQAFGQCASQPASICAVLGDPGATFCTKLCNDSMPDLDQCGEDATCVCQGANCGCTPNSCLGL